MDKALLDMLVQTGGVGVLTWMLYNVWQELKVQNQRIYDLLLRQKQESELANMWRSHISTTLGTTQPEKVSPPPQT